MRAGVASGTADDQDRESGPVRGTRPGYRGPPDRPPGPPPGRPAGRYQLVDSGMPSAKPDGFWIPIVARSWNSSSVRAPA